MSKNQYMNQNTGKNNEFQLKGSSHILWMAECILLQQKNEKQPEKLQKYEAK